MPRWFGREPAKPEEYLPGFKVQRTEVLPEGLGVILFGLASYNDFRDAGDYGKIIMVVQTIQMNGYEIVRKEPDA